MHARASRPILAAPVALLLAIALLPAARAQPLGDEVPALVLRPHALGTVESAPTRAAESSRPPTAFADAALRGAGWLGSSVRLDVPRDVVTGEYARPKFLVGLQSDSMKSWANSAGLDADHCMLPMLRARTRLSGDGDVNGTVWLYARCTFR